MTLLHLIKYTIYISPSCLPARYEVSQKNTAYMYRDYITMSEALVWFNTLNRPVPLRTKCPPIRLRPQSIIRDGSQASARLQSFSDPLTLQRLWSLSLSRTPCLSSCFRDPPRYINCYLLLGYQLVYFPKPQPCQIQEV